jgi:1-acyl-sn-glycerol-3-phosphate acyltransferase
MNKMAWRSKVIFTLLNLWARLFYRLKVEGLENVPLEGGCLVAPNHSGKLLADILALNAAVSGRRQLVGPGFDVRMMRRTWLSPIFQSFRQMIRVQRVRGASVEAILKMLRLLQQGEAIMIMPEGETNWDGRLAPIKPGTAWLAIKAQVPIVPCGINGAYDVWPRWSERMHRTGKITVRFGEPFYLEGDGSRPIDQETLDRGSQRIMSEITRLMD